MTKTPEVISSKEAAKMLGIAEGTLREWRHKQKENQPVFRKIGGCIRYSVKDVEKWLAKQAVSY